MNSKKYFQKEFATHNGRKFTVTYCEIQGAQPGPVLTLLAGQHGMEHIGPVLLRDMIEEFATLDFRGSLRICPCANPLALALDYEFYPEFEDLGKLDGYFYSLLRHDYEIYGLGRQHAYNMNRVWGRKDLKGVVPATALWLWENMCTGSDALLDMHCLQDDKPLIYAIDTPRNIEFASSFGIEAIFAEPLSTTDEWNKGTLERQATETLGIPAATIEFSRQHGYRKRDSEIGRTGLYNTMKGLKMLDGMPCLKHNVNYIKNEPDWVFALTTKQVGHIHYHYDEYEQVKKNDVIFRISSLETLEILDEVKSPVDGIMGRRQPHPVSNPARPVCNVMRTEVTAMGNAKQCGACPQPNLEIIPCDPNLPIMERTARLV